MEGSQRTTVVAESTKSLSSSANITNTSGGSSANYSSVPSVKAISSIATQTTNLKVRSDRCCFDTASDQDNYKCCGSGATKDRYYCSWYTDAEECGGGFKDETSKFGSDEACRTTVEETCKVDCKGVPACAPESGPNPNSLPKVGTWCDGKVFE
jgi:hypothetical protein